MLRGMRSTPFLPLGDAARRLGVPATWLLDEALAGHIPYLRTRWRLLVDPDEVERVLRARAGSTPDRHPHFAREEDHDAPPL